MGGGGYSNGKLDLSTSDNAYAALLGDAGTGAPAAGTACGGKGLTRVVPGNPAESLLYNKLNAKTTGKAAPCGNPMPASGAALPTASINVISQWIMEGAKP
jgi:hypothetical protein